MRNRNFFWAIVAILILLDFYVFQAVKVVSSSASQRTRLIIFTCYWIVSGLAILMLALMPFMNVENWSRNARTYVFATLLGLFFAKFFAVIIFLIDDIRRLLQWIAGKLFFRNTETDEINSGGISRSVFMSWLGLAVGGGLFGTLIYGFKNKYNYHVKRIKLSYDNLPAAFRGLKIVQISDIHSGSFSNKEAVAKGVVKILEEKPDLILFTGDLVNDQATEMHDYMDVFNKLQAPMGVFSTLGNHDYGDYKWGHTPMGDQAREKADNLKRLKEIHGELGWRLLMDEHVPLERNGQQIALIGVQNISAKARFFSYG
ncbi:MAG: metallophosphoesterase, partial [Bacteroidetes bacterium]|nr:metallophosphoesterase [Bacteroidota bacterium]